MNRLAAVFLICTFALSALAQTAEVPPIALDTGLLGTPLILRPKDVPKGVAFLFSGEEGWGGIEQRSAEELRDAGIITVGVNLPAYDALLDKDDGECLYLISDIEGVSYQLQRAAGVQTYRSPVIGGFGVGGGLILSMVQQTPAATIGEAIAVDPLPAPSLNKPLCGLDDTPPDVGVKSIKALFTPSGDPSSKAIAQAVSDRGVSIAFEDVQEAPAPALAAAIVEHFKTAPQGGDHLSGLPLVELPAEKPTDTMAIVYSGDGGWRDIDKSISEVFQSRGVSTLGIDSLRYFWSERKPAEVAHDLDLIIDRYKARWRAKKVLLIGFSFGADVLPEVFNLLSPQTKSLVKQISLLGFAGQSSFEISVAGWLGADSDDGSSSLPQLSQINPALVQCIYGREDEESICPKLANLKIELVATEGGHHFDEDYEALADKILEGAKRR